jgi:hypothetical protein
MNRLVWIVPALCACLSVRVANAQSPRLVGWWKCDDAPQATVLADASGYGRHAARGAGLSIVDGRFGKAARFDGTGGAWASFTSPLMTNMTISAWVYMEGVPTNILPRIMQIGGDVYFLMPSNTLGQLSLGCRGNNWSTNVQDPFKFVTNRWFHTAVVYRQQYTSETARVVWPTFYMNGVRCGDPGAKAAYSSDIPTTSAFIGNNSAGGTRPLNGLMDDVRLYDAPLSDREVLALYQNSPLAVDAGTDQTCARAATRLQGRLVNTNPFQRDLAAVASWAAVSNPAGAAPVLATPWLPDSAVTLPEPGTYVFRLTVSNELGQASDEVTVIRADEPPANAAPAVTPLWLATNTVLGAGAPLAATVTDDGLPGATRFRWRKVSGPGAVFFDDAFTNATAAYFSTHGAYVLALDADDGALTGSAQVSVAVSLPGNTLTNGLLHWWRMDEDPASKRTYDSAGTNTLNLLNQAILQPGKSGNGLREPKPDAVALATNVLASSDLMTFSAWFYYDSAYTNNPYMRLFNCGPNFYLLYNRSANQLDLSTTATGEGTSTNYTWAFPEARLTSNRWFHVAVLFDRRPAASGSRQTLYLNGLRYRSNAFTAFPGGASAFPGAAAFTAPFVIGNTSPSGGTRNFDGVLDELRVYTRFITDEEALLLAADPDNNHAPVIEGPAELTARVAQPLSLQGVVTDDGLPAGKSLSTGWSVVSGNAARVLLADAAAPGTVATFTKTGAYVMMLSASDGELQSAAFVHVEVRASGTMVLVK